MLVEASFCFCAATFTDSPSENALIGGDCGIHSWSLKRDFPDLCTTFGGVYGSKSVNGLALNFWFVFLSGM